MPLSMTSPVLASDIQTIKMYKRLKVWLLIGIGGEEIVIKTDALTDQHIKGSGVPVKAIDRTAKMKIMAPSEIAELSLYAQTWLDVQAFWTSLGNPPPDADTKKAHESLKESLTFGFPFTKMIKQTMHNLEDCADRRGNTDKTMITTFVTTLKGDGGLEKLGQVVAGDLFNGNMDRFSPFGTTQTFKVGTRTIRFKAVVNPSNIIIVANQWGYSASMLDYVDPQAASKDINSPLSTIERGDKPWAGRVLADKKIRHEFAKEIISDLEAVFHPNKTFFSQRNKLGRNAAKRLERGMVEGAELIRKGLERKYNPNRWTPGATDRYKVLLDAK